MQSTTLHFLLIAGAVILSTILALFTLNGPSTSETPMAIDVSQVQRGEQATEDLFDAGFLYVQQALGGKFTAAPAGNPGEYTLTLNNVWPETTYFADRPSRVWGRMGNSEFAASGLFSPTSPPNASLVLSDSNLYGDLVLLELLNPQYDSANQSFSYSVRFLEGQNPEVLMETLSSSSPSGTASFGSASLYIDDYSYNCTGTVLFTVQDPSGSPLEGVSLICCNTLYKGNKSNAQGHVSVDYPIL